MTHNAKIVDKTNKQTVLQLRVSTNSRETAGRRGKAGVTALLKI